MIFFPQRPKRQTLDAQKARGDPCALKELSRGCMLGKAVYPATMHRARHRLASYRSVIKDSLGLCDWCFPSPQDFETKEEYEAELPPSAARSIGIYRRGDAFRASKGWTDHRRDGAPSLPSAVNRSAERVRNNGATARPTRCDPALSMDEKTDGTHLSAAPDEFRALLDRIYDRLDGSRHGAPTRNAGAFGVGGRGAGPDG